MEFLNMVTYTNINKPVGTSYTPINPVGKEQYDQASITYDDTNVFYDGTNEALYTNLTKPSGTTYTKLTKPT